jgi:hypothetical protein
VKQALEEGGRAVVRSPDNDDELEPVSLGAGIGELLLEVNAGKPWSELDIADLRQSAAFGSTDLEIAQFLCHRRALFYAKFSPLFGYVSAAI